MGNHSDWTYLFWDRESAQIFLDTHYPWFSATFKGYPKTVLQGTSAYPCPHIQSASPMTPSWRLSLIHPCLRCTAAGCVRCS